MELEQGTKFSKSHLGPTREIVHDDLGIVACVGPFSISTHQVKIDKDIQNVDLSMNKRKAIIEDLIEHPSKKAREEVLCEKRKPEAIKKKVIKKKPKDNRSRSIKALTRNQSGYSAIPSEGMRSIPLVKESSRNIFDVNSLQSPYIQIAEEAGLIMPLPPL